MIEVKSCKDMHGNRIKIGDTVKWKGRTEEQVGKVESILKAGYFIELRIEGREGGLYMPKLGCEKVFEIIE